MKIKYSIISRGIILVSYGNKKVEISGELTFSPQVFYANINSIKNWISPFEKIAISDEEKKEIIDTITFDSAQKELKILFD